MGFTGDDLPGLYHPGLHGCRGNGDGPKAVFYGLDSALHYHLGNVDHRTGGAPEGDAKSV